MSLSLTLSATRDNILRIVSSQESFMQLTFRAAIVCLLGSALAPAQGTDATVSGTIIDPSGAHFAEVKVSALHSETGVAVRTTTNQLGIYTFASLPPGTYRFTAEHPGFRTAVISDIELEVGARLTINMPLELGATSETVEVRGASSELNIARSSAGDVISGQKLLALPVAGRSSYDLIATQPGVIQGAGTNGSFNMNGNRGGAVNFTTDGINSQDNLL